MVVKSFLVSLIALLSVSFLSNDVQAQSLIQQDFGLNSQQLQLEELEGLVTVANSLLEEDKQKLAEITEEKKELRQTIDQIKQEIADLEARVEAKRRAEIARQRAYEYMTSSQGVAGNTYAYGYCTWYVKNRRPDLPNGLGHANTWYARASYIGLPTGTQPKAGAVGATTRGALGHVVYVESVNSDGTINISEMNAVGWNVISHRTASAGEFVYIY